MTNNQKIDSGTFDKDDVRQYLQMVQDTINRMSSNSSNCKNWALTIVTALLALCTSVSELRAYLFISIIPVVLFWGLDLYYLLQENKYRNHEQEFIEKYARKDSAWKDLVYSFNASITQKNKKYALLWHCFKSYSVMLFYPIIIVIICLLSYFISYSDTCCHYFNDVYMKNEIWFMA